MSDRSFDVIVVGAGPAGEVAAGRVADGGLEVAIVEDDLVGGECSYYACMPSKALLRPAQALAEARRVPGAREAATGQLDVRAVLARRDEVIHDRDDAAQLPWLEEHGVVLIRGHGRLTGERTVATGDATLTARRAVILAPGSAALVPPIEGLREARPWTNREATTAEAIPARLLVLGGGVAGVELAQAYATLGSAVTVVEALDRLIGREEAFAAEQVADALRAAGVELHLGRKATRVARDGDAGEVTLELEDGTRLHGDELLCAIGRRPRTDDLGLDALGLEPGATIEVDARLRVPGHDWLHVVGDANGRALLTHAGKHQARVAADAILGRGGELPPLADGPLVPRVIFCEPQVAAVGHTERSARDAGVAVRVVDVPTDGTAGASFVGRGSGGTSRLVIDEARGVIVGATFTGAEVAEWLHAATIAVVGEVPLRVLAHATPAFPTRSEVWLNLLAAAGA